MELQGKKIAFLGDSITEGVGVSDKANCRYDNRLAKQYGLAQTFNYGIGGTRFAHQSVPSENPRHDLCFCGRAYNIDKSADIVVVYGGVNDYIQGDAYFGTMEDKTPKTFCGAIYFLMTLLRERHPNSTIVFMTPAHCNYKDVSDREPSPRPIKRDARPLAEYVEAVKARGKELGIPVLDMFEKLGLDPNCEEQRVKFTVDGLHFNDEGHAYIAKALGDLLTSL